MSDKVRRLPSCVSHLNKIDAEDLQYVERDLCFRELVSLGFLLFGEDRTNAQFVLQKLLVLSSTLNNPVASASCTTADLLRKYVSINPNNWRAHLVEALAIIGARRVLRKLGFQWDELQQHYLPHIVELSLHVHPLLKALYKMCERLTPIQTGRLVLQINEKWKQPSEHLPFYNFEYLEIFLLDWITRRTIYIGDAAAQGADLQVLLQYFKLEELDELKRLLVDTINTNAEKPREIPVQQEVVTNDTSHDSSVGEEQNVSIAGIRPTTSDKAAPSNRTCELESSECYTVRRQTAGIVLIINQSDFTEETDPNLLHLLPKKKLKQRLGTNVDKKKIESVFSSFGYTPLVYDNITHNEILERLRETCRRIFLFDSLIVFILSHGIDGAVYGINSIPVQIDDIEKIIADEMQQGKPKMLVIQACQKDEADELFNVNAVPKKPAASSPKLYADMIKAMSTVRGHVSMRHTEFGTWFIQSLCDAVDRTGDTKHLMDIFTAVTREVSNKRGDRNESMVPLTSTTLTKHFFLPCRK